MVDCMFWSLVVCRTPMKMCLCKMILEQSRGLKYPLKLFLSQRTGFVTQLGASKFLPTRTQNLCKIDPKWYHLASKKRPKWYLSDPEASNLPYNRFYDSELGSWRSLRPPNPSQFAPKILLKSIMKALCLTNSKLTAFWNGSGTSWTPILKCFFKYLRAKMISNNDKNTKMKILQNTCVFTVKMHFRNLNNITTTLKKTLVFAHQALTKQRSKSDRPLDPKMGPSRQPKPGRKPQKNDIAKENQTMH